MDERRGDQPQSEPGTQPPAPSAATRLSPLQELQRARAAHAGRCRQCSDIDRPLCAVGEQLWRTWSAALDEAYKKLHGTI